MADTSNIFVCRGGDMTAYRLIGGHFANEGRRKEGRGQARKTFSATCYTKPPRA